MLVFNDNYKQILPLFKETADKAQMVSFDCEMTGVNYEPKTDGTKYDSQQFRYFKTKEVIKEFDLIQLGLTFFLKAQNEKEENYIERTFTFYLFKNSKLKSIKNPLFNHEMTCHPASLKFLNENHFDFNCLISKGIHYNKLGYKDAIKSVLEKEKILLSPSALFLSETNEKNLLETIIAITDFLISDTGKEKKRSFTLNSHQIMIYLLGCNLKQLNHFDHFSIVKDKSKEMTIIVEKRKSSLSIIEFTKAFGSLENFKSSLSMENIYKSRYQLPLNIEGNNEELIAEELGFSLFIDYISQKRIPIIGHNIYFDIMFIYEKLIDDLPDDFYTFKVMVNKYFPVIYDTKAIAVTTNQYPNTKLENLHKTIHKNKQNSYVSFYPDVINGFCVYNDMSDDMLHDAGYDSMITGECFILMNKALQNNYYTVDLKEIVHQTGAKEIVKENEIKIKRGWVDLSLFTNVNQYMNYSIMSIVDSPYAKVNWDMTKETRELYEKNEQLLIDSFNNVYWVKFNPKAFDHIITIYEIARFFENEQYDIFIVKSDYFSAFIEISTKDYHSEKDNLLKLIKEIQAKYQDKIINIIPSNLFYKTYKEEINY